MKKVYLVIVLIFIVIILGSIALYYIYGSKSNDYKITDDYYLELANRCESKISPDCCMSSVASMQASKFL